MEWNGTHQLLVCAGDFNAPGETVNAINKNKEFLLEANREVGLEGETACYYSAGTLLTLRLLSKS
jgi:hypothetical protein